jgi:hypothetical protein
MKSTHLIVLVCQVISVPRLTPSATSRSQLKVRPSFSLLSTSSATLVHPITVHRPLRSPITPRRHPPRVLPRFQFSFGRLGPRTCMISGIRTLCGISVRISLSLELFFNVVLFPERFTPDLCRTIYSKGENDANTISSRNRFAHIRRAEQENIPPARTSTSTSTMSPHAARSKTLFELGSSPLLPPIVRPYQKAAPSGLLDASGLCSWPLSPSSLNICSNRRKTGH